MSETRGLFLIENAELLVSLPSTAVDALERHVHELRVFTLDFRQAAQMEYSLDVPGAG